MRMVLSGSPALTICVPTYNRGKRVQALVSFLKFNLLPFTNDVEILVVNNCSDDGTEKLLEPLMGGCIRLFNRDEFLDTAELNMFHSAELCRGDFIWYHGDDDIPSVDTILHLVSMIKQDVADLFVCNSAVIDDDGVVHGRRMANMKSSHLDLSGDALIETAGFGFMLAGISNMIFRREYADVEVAWDAQALQPLYGHVCWILACFARRRTRIVNKPLVFYRISDFKTQVAHFKKVAKRKDLADQYFWGVGMALQFKWLVERGVITPGSLPRIFEGRRDGSRFKLLNECIHKIYSQVVESIESDESRFRVDPVVFSDIRQFLISCDLFVYDLLEPISKLNEIAQGKRPRREVKELKREFEKIHRLQDSDVYRNNWKAESDGYQIYRMACHWVAIKPEIEGGILAALSVIDLKEQLPVLILAADFDSLIERAAKIAQEEAINLFQVSQSESELDRVARQLLRLTHRAVHEYATSVEIYRQTTWVTRVITYPLAQCLRLSRRVVARLNQR